MIKIEHLDKFYKDKQVLFDFSMDIHDRENKIYGIVGPNGAGKTTLLKVFTGLLNYSQGSITVDGHQDYFLWCKDNVGLIPTGERGLRFKNTVYDNIMCFAANKGVSDKKARILINEYAETMKYRDFLRRRIETLSTGEKKKAMLLCGLCSDMNVIIMDEPSNGIDIDAQIEIKELLKKLATLKNKTFLLSSHDMGFLSGLADHYAFIFQGRKVEEISGSMKAEEIFNKYASVKEKFGVYNEKIF